MFHQKQNVFLILTIVLLFFRSKPVFTIFEKKNTNQVLIWILFLPIVLWYKRKFSANLKKNSFSRSMWFFENENFAVLEPPAHAAKFADFLEFNLYEYKYSQSVAMCPFSKIGKQKKMTPPYFACFTFLFQYPIQ